jgi:hypothetical protein
VRDGRQTRATTAAPIIPTTELGARPRTGGNDAALSAGQPGGATGRRRLARRPVGRLIGWESYPAPVPLIECLTANRGTPPAPAEGRGRLTEEDGTETLGPFSLIHGPPPVFYDHEGGAAAVTSHGRRVGLR